MSVAAETLSPLGRLFFPRFEPPGGCLTVIYAVTVRASTEACRTGSGTGFVTPFPGPPLFCSLQCCHLRP
jgi:hypothetical protein